MKYARLKFLMLFINFYLSLGSPFIPLKSIIGAGGREPALGRAGDNVRFIGYQIPYQPRSIYRVLHDRHAGGTFEDLVLVEKVVDPFYYYDIESDPQLTVVYDPAPPSRQIRQSIHKNPKSEDDVQKESSSRSKSLLDGIIMGIKKDIFSNGLPQIQHNHSDNRHPNSRQLLSGIMSGIKKDIFGEEITISGGSYSTGGIPSDLEGIGQLSPEEFKRVTRQSGLENRHNHI